MTVMVKYNNALAMDRQINFGGAAIDQRDKFTVSSKVVLANVNEILAKHTTKKIIENFESEAMFDSANRHPIDAVIMDLADLNVSKKAELYLYYKNRNGDIVGAGIHYCKDSKAWVSFTTPNIYCEGSGAKYAQGAVKALEGLVDAIPCIDLAFMAASAATECDNSSGGKVNTYDLSKLEQVKCS